MTRFFAIEQRHRAQPGHGVFVCEGVAEDILGSPEHSACTEQPCCIGRESEECVMWVDSAATD